MKKKFNIDETESWVKRGFTAADRKITYHGSITEEALDPDRKKVKRQREGGGFFTSPALQVTGAFLAAAIVGGGTFGALKYLEYIGAQRISGQPGDDTSISTGIEPDVTAPDNNNVPAKDYEDLLSEVTKVEYDDEASQGGYAEVLTGGRIYGLRAYPYGVTTKKSNDEIATELFDTAALFDVEIPLSGDFDIVNNVENREMEFLSAEIRKENTQEKTSFNAATGNSIAKIGEYMRNAEPGTYYVSVMVSWDFKPLKEVGDSYRVFTLPFKLIVSDSVNSGVKYDESNSFETAHFIKVTSGGKAYYPYVHLLTMSADTMEIDYGEPDIEDIIIPYNDDFRIVSNVVDKSCTVHSITVHNTDPQVEGMDLRFTSFAELENHLKNGFYSGSLYVKIVASWVDGTDYGIGFTVTKAPENDNKYIDVNEIYLPLINFTEPLNIDISFPTETKYKNLRMLKNKDLYITVYRYETEDTDKNTYGLFITRGDEFIAELPPVDGCVPPEMLLYVRQTPSGDPTIFFTVCKNADNGDKWTTLYALDLVTCQLSYISSVGPHAYNMVSRVIDCGFSYKVDTCALGLEVIGRPIPDIGADDYYVAQIRYKNGAYLIDPPHPSYETGKTYDPYRGVDDTSVKNRITVSTKSESYAIKTGSDETVVFDGFLSVSDEDIIEEWVLLDGENKKELLRGNGYEFKKIADYISVLSIIKQHGFIVEIETRDGVPFRFTLLQKQAQTDTPAPKGKAKLIVGLDGDAVAPGVYSTWYRTAEDSGKPGLKIADQLDIPVLMLPGPVAFTLEYDYNSVRLEKITLHRFGGSITGDPQTISGYAYDSVNSVSYVEAEFMLLTGGSDRADYMSYMFALAKPGGAKCSPYSDEGDAPANFTITVGDSTYAPYAVKAENMNENDISSSYPTRFGYFNVAKYIRIPEMDLTNNDCSVSYGNGYKLSYVAAFADFNTGTKIVITDEKGFDDLPLEEYYAVFVFEKDGISNEQYMYAVKIINNKTKDPAQPEYQTNDTVAGINSVLEAVSDEIKDYVAGKMWNGMTWAQLVESLSRLKQLKQDILADNSASRIEETDGMFVKYAGDGVYDFLAFIEKNEEIREARLILYSNAEFDLPFGITPDMTAEQALKKMGFTAEQISEMNGQFRHGDLTLWYSETGLTVTSGLIDGASFGIELYPEGKTYKNTAYIEFEK